jgi:hypothetical protein
MGRRDSDRGNNSDENMRDRWLTTVKRRDSDRETTVREDTTAKVQLARPINAKSIDLLVTSLLVIPNAVANSPYKYSSILDASLMRQGGL